MFSRPHPRPPLSPGLASASHPNSLTTCTHLATCFPNHKTHCAPDSPAHDDLRAEGEGRVSPVAVTDACGENTGIATGINQDVMHHRLIVLEQLGLKLDEGRRQIIVKIFYIKSCSSHPLSPNKTILIPHFCFSFFSFFFF